MFQERATVRSSAIYCAFTTAMVSIRSYSTRRNCLTTNQNAKFIFENYLSFLKCFRHLQIFAQSFLTCLMDKDALIEQFYSFSKDVIRLCAMNKRKSRHSTAQKLRLLYEGGS